ncbi:MAG: tyrosine--tRNA ligase [Ignavibacteriales bacterium]
MANVFDMLVERGLVQQTTNEEEIKRILGNEKITFYTGFDPTADSLHVGHFMALTVMSHLQKAGHKPIVILGGGTAMVGDPTGKTDMRKMLTREQIQHNTENFRKQFSKFLDFNDGKALMLDNYDWLGNVKYIDFLRDIGKYFSVNKMLTYECFKTRLEKGLSFIEFNYMLMQSYDFLHLFQKHNCVLQLGGDDQWANILGGTDLIRRVESKETFGLTITLLTTSEGKKMGKTESGAVWLDPEKTSPYDFYQYWRNVGDNDVEKCLSLLTTIPMEEVRTLCANKDERINQAKKVLAFELTKLIHGEEEAKKAEQAASALFGGTSNLAEAPGIEIPKSEIEAGIPILDLMVKADLVPSKSEARRVVQQGGAFVNDIAVSDVGYIINSKDIKDGLILLKKGKKSFAKIEIK